MVNSNYKKGYALEYKTKNVLEENGWLAMRSPSSKSPVDIMATKDNKTLLIQCKKTTKQETMHIRDLDAFIELSKKHKTTPLLVYSFNKSPVYIKEIKSPKETLKRLDKHVELIKFLKIVEIENSGNDMIITD